MQVSIELSWCDDSTEFELDVNESEFEFLTKIQKLSKETSTYSCMPVLEVKKITQ